MARIPPVKKGDPPANPTGRPKGTKNKYSILRAKALEEQGATPLEFMMALVRKDASALKKLDIPLKDVTTLVRQKAADSALPYVHRKMPIGIDGGADGRPIAVFTAAQLMALSDEELEHLNLVMSKLAEIGAQEAGES